RRWRIGALEVEAVRDVDDRLVASQARGERGGRREIMVDLAHIVILVAYLGSPIREYPGIAGDQPVGVREKRQPGKDARINIHLGGLRARGISAQDAITGVVGKRRNRGGCALQQEDAFVIAKKEGLVFLDRP